MADQLDGMNAEQLRELVRGPQAPITFDPNHPPHVPYVFREFPKMMYRSDGSNKVVDNKAQQDALGEGWQTTPFIPGNDAPAPAAPEPPPPVAPRKKKFF